MLESSGCLPFTSLGDLLAPKEDIITKVIILSIAPTHALGDLPIMGGQCKNHIKGPTVSLLLPQGIPAWDHGGVSHTPWHLAPSSGKGP